MKFVSLFAGIGGIDLGLERAGHECVGQVELDEYATQVLEKHWPDVPRIKDVKDFQGREFGEFDMLVGGYPCQPFSVAGNRKGEHDERHLWPEVLRILRNVRPKYLFVENVTGHLSLGFGRVLGDLAESGYDAEWDCIPAAAVGAPHRRDRVFIVATRRDVPDADNDGFVTAEKRRSITTGSDASQARSRISIKPTGCGYKSEKVAANAGSTTSLANADNGGRLHGQAGEQSAEARQHAQRDSSAGSTNVANTKSKPCNGSNHNAGKRMESRSTTKLGNRGGPPDMAETNGERRKEQHTATIPRETRQCRRATDSLWREWATEPDVGRVAHGVPNRVDRLRGLGNAVVPQVAQSIGERLPR